MLEAALSAHAGGNPYLHRDWLRCLLEEYYDPMYAWQWQKNHERVVFRGSAEQVQEWIKQMVDKDVYD